MPTRNGQVPWAARSASHAGSPPVQTWVRFGKPCLSRNGVLVALTPCHSARQSVVTGPPPGTSGSLKVPASASGCTTAKVEKLVTPLVLTVCRAVLTVVGSGVYPAPTHGPLAPQLPVSVHTAPPTIQVPVLKRPITRGASLGGPGGVPVRRGRGGGVVGRERVGWGRKSPGRPGGGGRKRGRNRGAPPGRSARGGTSAPPPPAVAPRIERPAVTREETTLEVKATVT